MRSNKFKKVLFISTFVLNMGFSAESKAQYESWEIGPRTLPASVDVSDIFHESLLKTPAPDVSQFKIVISTDDEWEAFAKEKNAPASKAALTLAEALKVTINNEKIAGVNVHRLTPKEISEEHRNHLFIYVHGGAWILNEGYAGTVEAIIIAQRLKIEVISIDYRMIPQYPAPAATDDVVAVWKELIKVNSPSSIAIGGSSAGGNITLSSVHKFKDLGLPVPGALYLGTPCVDLNMTGDSRFLNEGVDRLLPAWKNIPQDAARMYAGEFDLKNPYVSPIYGNFSDFPPSYIISGTRDLLLSDAVRGHRALRRAGVDADLHIYEGQSHGDYAVVFNAPESVEHYAELNAFLLKHLLKSILPKAIDENMNNIEVPKSSIY